MKYGIIYCGYNTEEYVEASLKPFIDALKLSKVIKDDSWEYIKKIDVDQVKSKEKKLLIMVQENE